MQEFLNQVRKCLILKEFSGKFVSYIVVEPCALRSTQPLKVSNSDFSWGKGGRCVWLTTYHPCSAETSRYSGVLTYPEPLGPPRPVAGDLYFTFYKVFSNYQLNAQFFYFSTIYMLHYAPQHVSSSALLILRRTNCIATASRYRHPL